MPDVEKGFADNSDDWRISDVQFLGRASVKRKSRSCPTKNSCANLTPLRFCRYFTDDNSQLVAGRIAKRNVNVAVCCSFYSNNAACECKPIILNPGAF